MVPADDNVCPYTTFSSLLNLVSLIESVLDPNRTRCFIVSDLGTNYLQSILSNGDGIISVLLCGHLYLTQREFVHLCEKAQILESMAQSELLSCSYRERNLMHFLSYYIFTETK